MSTSMYSWRACERPSTDRLAGASAGVRGRSGDGSRAFDQGAAGASWARGSGAERDDSQDVVGQGEEAGAALDLGEAA